MNTGTKAVTSHNNLLTTVAWKINGEVQYALEGSVFIAGAVVQWLRDGLKIIQTSADVEELAAAGMYGAIIGKALYEGAIQLPDLHRFL